MLTEDEATTALEFLLKRLAEIGASDVLLEIQEAVRDGTETRDKALVRETEFARRRRSSRDSAEIRRRPLTALEALKAAVAVLDERLEVLPKLRLELERHIPGAKIQWTPDHAVEFEHESTRIATRTFSLDVIQLDHNQVAGSTLAEIKQILDGARQ